MYVWLNRCCCCTWDTLQLQLKYIYEYVLYKYTFFTAAAAVVAGNYTWYTYIRIIPTSIIQSMYDMYANNSACIEGIINCLPIVAETIKRHLVQRYWLAVGWYFEAAAPPRTSETCNTYSDLLPGTGVVMMYFILLLHYILRVKTSVELRTSGVRVDAVAVKWWNDTAAAAGSCFLKIELNMLFFLAITRRIRACVRTYI